MLLLCWLQLPGGVHHGHMNLSSDFLSVECEWFEESNVFDATALVREMVFAMGQI